MGRTRVNFRSDDSDGAKVTQSDGARVRDEESGPVPLPSFYTSTNEIMAETTVYHYTNEEGAAGIRKSGEIWTSGPADAAFGPGVYGTGKAPTQNSQSHIIENNYGGGNFGESRSGHADHVVPVKVPKRGPNAPKAAPDVEPHRDVKIISEKNHKLSPDEIERIQPFEEYKQNAGKYAAQDTLLEVGQAGVIGAAIGGGVSAAYAGADLVQGKIDANEAATRVAKGAGSGLAAGAGTKLVDAGCQAAAKTLASKGLPVMAKGCSNAVPVLGAAIGVCTAASNIVDACAVDAKPEEKKEAAASSVEAAAGVASTVAVVALECSGPVGWGILGAGLLAGWVIRNDCDLMAKFSEQGRSFIAQRF